MRIGLAYNQRPPGVDTTIDPKVVSSLHGPIDAFVEWDEPETIAAVANALSAFGDVVRLEAVDDFAQRLASANIDFLFNMAEGLHGPNREAHVPAIAEFLDIPYLGSDPLAVSLTRLISSSSLPLTFPPSTDSITTHSSSNQRGRDPLKE